MSDIIPPLISDTPPPPPCLDEEDEDEFGNFIGSNDLSYGCENFSLPTTPEHSPKIVSIPNQTDINSNTEESLALENEQKLDSCKDNYDRRKSQSDDYIDSNTSKLYNEIDADTNFTLSSYQLNKDDNDTNCYFNKSLEMTVGSSKTIAEDLPETLSGSDKISQSQNEESDQIIVLTEKFKTAVDSHLPRPPKTFDYYVPNNNQVALVSINKRKCESESVDQSNVSYNSSMKQESEDVNISDNDITFSDDKKSNEFNIHKDTDGKIHSTDNLASFDIIKTEHDEMFNNHKFDEALDTQIQIRNEKEFSDIISDNITNETKEKHNIAKNTPQDLDKKNRLNDLSYTVDSKDNSFGTINVHNSTTVCITDNFSEDDDFADFTDFQTEQNVSHENEISITNIPNIKTSSDKVTTENDSFNAEFDDFGDFVSTSHMANIQDLNADNDDDFGDFQDPSTGTIENLPLPSNPLEKAQKLFEETFPKIENELSDCVFEELEKNSHIFEILKDVTDTPALMYEWQKSSSQKLLLKALNVDERNILPHWNPSMPIFAANLSLQPLEPIKTELLTNQALPSSPSIAKKPLQPEIPTAQFDWKGAGLENPLETVSQDSVPAATDVSINLNIMQNIEESKTILQKRIPLKPESDPNTPVPADLSDFSADIVEIPQAWSNTTCLRETHISNKTDVTVEHTWTNPVSEFTLPQTYITEVSQKEPKSVTEEDDFDDFQAAPLEIPNWTNEILSQTPDSILSVELDQPKNSSFTDEPQSFTTCITNSYLTKPSMSDDQSVNKQDNKLSHQILQKEMIQDDEFTDFQSSVSTSLANSKLYSDSPLQANSIPYINTVLHSQPALPVNLSPMSLEPLKPVPVYQKPNDLTAQINWPDPGVTEDEIKKFEEIFSTTVEKSPKISEPDINIGKQNISENSWSKLETRKDLSSKIPKTIESSFPVTVNIPVTKTLKNETPTRNNLTKKDTPNEIWPDFIKPSIENHIQTPEKTKVVDKKEKKKIIDDDEWTDFVSAQKPSPVHKVTARELERTSSPDLPLSVFNLGSVQPAKQPIPVITPHGLVQTKLSASAINTSPKFRQKNTKQIFQPVQNIPMITPSIISNQYVSQAYNTNSVGTRQQSTSYQGFNNADDEWGEFVSSPLPPSQAVNGYRQQMTWQGSNQTTSWTKAPPNIITNPRHYIQSASDINNSVSNVTTTKKNMVPNLVLPELDFVAPKNRISVAKKK